MVIYSDIGILSKTITFKLINVIEHRGKEKGFSINDLLLFPI